MGQVPHIIIIGAGLIGLSTADALIRKGAQVTILEKQSGPGLGAGFSNSGMIHPSQARPWNWPDLTEAQYEQATRATFDLATTSARILRRRIGELGLSTQSLNSGIRQIFDSIAIGENLRQAYESFGIPVLEERTGPWTFGRYVLSFPEDGCTNAYIYSQALAAHLETSGVRLHYNTEKISFDIRSGRLEGMLRDGQKMDCDHVVVAAGYESREILNRYDIDLPLYSEPGFAQNFKRPDMDLPDMPIMHHASRSALTVFDDHIRLSGTVGEAGPEALTDIWEEIAPEIIEKLGPPINEWQGVRPMSRLGRPIIGPTTIDGLWVNSGHGHMGWTLSAGSGDLMAGQILNGQAAPDFELPG